MTIKQTQYLMKYGGSLASARDAAFKIRKISKADQKELAPLVGAWVEQIIGGAMDRNPADLQEAARQLEGKRTEAIAKHDKAAAGTLDARIKEVSLQLRLQSLLLNQESAIDGRNDADSWSNLHLTHQIEMAGWTTDKLRGERHQGTKKLIRTFVVKFQAFVSVAVTTAPEVLRARVAELERPQGDVAQTKETERSIEGARLQLKLRELVDDHERGGGANASVIELAIKELLVDTAAWIRQVNWIDEPVELRHLSGMEVLEAVMSGDESRLGPLAAAALHVRQHSILPEALESRDERISFVLQRKQQVSEVGEVMYHSLSHEDLLLLFKGNVCGSRDPTLAQAENEQIVRSIRAEDGSTTSAKAIQRQGEFKQEAIKATQELNEMSPNKKSAEMKLIEAARRKLVREVRAVCPNPFMASLALAAVLGGSLVALWAMLGGPSGWSQLEHLAAILGMVH